MSCEPSPAELLSRDSRAPVLFRMGLWGLKSMSVVYGWCALWF